MALATCAIERKFRFVAHAVTRSRLLLRSGARGKQ
jgi:hypothetical protein